MTNVDATGQSPAAEQPRPRGRKKAVLFCPVCGFEGSPTDEWIPPDSDGHRALACPNCGTVVAAQ